MSNAVIPANFGAVSAEFRGEPIENDLGAGVQGGYGVIGFKGKVWSIRKGGTDTPLMRDDGDGPRNSIEVVVLKAATVVSKIWYEKGYVEGSTAAPDCYSTNGVTPAAGATKKQSAACTNCPMNAWGSRITPAGKQGKACSDSKRLAVTPLGDIPNELFGGPMLLRVPAASLTEMAVFGEKMKTLGFPYYAFGTRISFDSNESYPKFVFGAIRKLTDDEARVVVKMRDSDAVHRVLAEEDHTTTAPPPMAAPSPFEQDRPCQTNNVVPMTPRPGTGAASTPSAPPAAPTSTTTISAMSSTSGPATPPSSVSTATTLSAQPDRSATVAVASDTTPEPTATGVEDFDAMLDKLI